MANRASSLWPWEEKTISLIEYRRSIESLEHFLNVVNVWELETIEDLSAAASLVGHDLETIVMTRGACIVQTKAVEEPGTLDPIEKIAHKYILVQPLATNGTEIVVMADDDHILIARLRLVQPMRYRTEDIRLRVPSNTDFAIGNRPIVADESLYVVDDREGRHVEYRPVQAPDSPEVQQGFGYALKDALRDILATLE